MSSPYQKLKIHGQGSDISFTVNINEGILSKNVCKNPAWFPFPLLWVMASVGFGLVHVAEFWAFFICLQAISKRMGCSFFS
jgi:hypothetical protein